MASSIGKRVVSIDSKSMTTDVSMSPRGSRVSGTGRRVLVDNGVYVAPKALRVNPWRA
jgi:hypothetical protein